MTDTNDSARIGAGKEQPSMDVKAFLKATTKVQVYDLYEDGTQPTLRLDGDGYGGLCIFFTDRDQVETMRDYLSAYLDGAAS